MFEPNQRVPQASVAGGPAKRPPQHHHAHHFRSRPGPVPRAHGQQAPAMEAKASKEIDEKGWQLGQVQARRKIRHLSSGL